MAGNVLKELTDQNFESEVVQSSLPVIVDFWAQWCGPCKMLTPILEKIAPDYQERLVIGKLDVDNNPDSASKYGINSIPTMLFFKGGKIAEQQVGLLAEKPLRAKIEEFLQ
jgi:thioredoxin 1